MAQFLRTLNVKNLTAFAEAKLEFGRGLNVFVGENASGKTHLLKLAYAVMAVSAEVGKSDSKTTTRIELEGKLASKLVGVFRPDSLGHLARGWQAPEWAEVNLSFSESELDTAFSFPRISARVGMQKMPTRFLGVRPAFIPTRELLTLGPKFVSVYDERYLDFEETWRDTCQLLGVPQRKEPPTGKLLLRLGQAMGGEVLTDRDTGRFYFREHSAAAGGNGGASAAAAPNTETARKLEIHLLAEGLRKLGTVAYLVANGTLLDNGFLFWDEPEANLNPRLIRAAAPAILELSRAGIQVFIATHSLFLLRELEMLSAKLPQADRSSRFFGLHATPHGTEITPSDSLSGIGDITALDEEILQSDKYLEQRL